MSARTGNAGASTEVSNSACLFFPAIENRRIPLDAQMHLWLGNLTLIQLLKHKLN
jgi:hypothetical protein